MKTNEQLINNIIGQLNGINKMMEDNKDCFQVIIQMKAAKSAMASLLNKIIKEEYIQCLRSCKNKQAEENLQKLVLELVK